MLWIKEKGTISNKEYVELNKVSRRTATRELQDMVEKDILKTVGKGKRDLSYALLAQKLHSFTKGMTGASEHYDTKN